MQPSSEPGRGASQPRKFNHLIAWKRYRVNEIKTWNNKKSRVEYTFSTKTITYRLTENSCYSYKKIIKE